MADSPALVWQIDGPIAWITLNRPEKMNCWNGEMYDLLGDAVTAIEGAPDVRCVVVIGAGGNFSTGGDLAWYRQQREAAHERGEHFQYDYASYRRFKQLRMPVIAAIDGMCLMAGMNFATFFCDIRLATERARFNFALPETGGEDVGGLGNRHLYGTPYPWHMSIGDVLYLCMAGETFDASRAMQAGLVQELVPSSDLEVRTRQLAERIARLPRDRVWANKELYTRYVSSSYVDFAPLAELVERPMVSAQATERYLERTRRFAEGRRDSQ